MSADVQRTIWCRNIAENFNRLSRVHERYRQTTDGRPMTYRERSLKRINDDDDDDDDDYDNDCYCYCY